MNFVKAMLAFQDYAAREALSANEVMLFLALFRVMNDRYWPRGMQKITNNQLLAHTTFYGTKRDETLRENRQKLADRGLIAFAPGDRRAKQPEYRICWEALGLEETEDGPRESAAESAEPAFSPETAPEAAPDFAPEKRGKNGGTALYNNISQGENINKNGENSKRANPPLPAVCGQGTHKAWFDPARPEEGCDDAWRTSGRARLAIAQRMIDYNLSRGMDTEALVDELGAEGCDLVFVLEVCMRFGLPPAELQRLAAGCRSIWQWSLRVKEKALRWCGTDNLPPEWREQVETRREDMERCL